MIPQTTDVSIETYSRQVLSILLIVILGNVSGDEIEGPSRNLRTAQVIDKRAKPPFSNQKKYQSSGPAALLSDAISDSTNNICPTRVRWTNKAESGERTAGNFGLGEAKIKLTSTG